MVVGICSRLGECLIVPDVQVAGGDVVSGVIVIADREVERISGGATLLVIVVEGVNAGGSVSVVVPRVGVAGILGERLVCALVDCQI